MRHHRAGRRGRLPATPSTLLASTLPAAFDWCDSSWVALPPGSPRDPDYWRRRLFATPRQDKHLDLMALRDRAVRRLGLKSATTHGGKTWPVLAHTPDEVVVGLDDIHLDFRVSLSVRRRGSEPGTDVLVVVTAVRRHNLLGQCYFAFVRAPHRLLVPRWIERTVHDEQRPAIRPARRQGL